MNDAIQHKRWTGPAARVRTAGHWLALAGLLAATGCNTSTGPPDGSGDVAQTLGQLAIDFARALFAAWIL